MITAAEKFDLVPPWCVVKNGDDGYSWWRIESHDGTRCALGPNDDGWSSGCGPYGYIGTESEARRIARLTCPLDSWEPGADFPLPVEGWRVAQDTTGRWFVHTRTDAEQPIAHRFTTRRAAIVWAWTEAEHTDGAGATDGQDDRGVLGWEAYDQLCKTVDDAECDIVAIDARVSKVEGVLARICPEADSQTDGKGRTLVQIDAALEVSYRWHNAAHSAIQATQDKVDDHAARLDKLERLVAAQVPVPAKVNVRSDAASTVEAMTEAAASDEGWREMLVPRKHHGSDDLVYWCTPHGDCEPCSASCPEDGWDWRRGGGTSTRVAFRGKITSEHLRIRAELPPPPNLAEWWKPVAKTTTESGDDAAHRFAKALVAASDAVPPTYRVGDDLAAWVRNLASAHDLGVKAQAELRTRITELERSEGDLAVDNAGWMRDADNLRTQLAAAQAATVAAEGRAETAKKRATEAESKLADLWAKVEELKASLT